MRVYVVTWRRRSIFRENVLTQGEHGIVGIFESLPRAVRKVSRRLALSNPFEIEYEIEPMKLVTIKRRKKR